MYVIYAIRTPRLRRYGHRGVALSGKICPKSVNRPPPGELLRSRLKACVAEILHPPPHQPTEAAVSSVIILPNGVTS